MMLNMHDWTLISVLVDWALDIVTIKFKTNQSKEAILVANGFTDLHVPKQEEWGESVSINKIIGPVLLKNGNYYIELEVQSGDRLYLEARSIQTPIELTH